MTIGCFRQTALESMLEQLKVLVIFCIQTRFSNKFPQALNQIEIGGVGRQKEDFYPEMSSPLEHEPTAWIASIIHHQGNRPLQLKQSNLLQQFADTGRGDVAVVGHRDQLMRDGMQGSQDVEALPSAGCTDQDASERPEITQIGSQHKMGSIDEKDRSRPCFRLL